MTSNKLIRAFRPFAPTGKHSFTGAYVTLVFQNIEPSERFSPRIQIQLNDIHDAEGRRLELKERTAAHVANKIADLFGNRAAFDFKPAPGISSGGASTLSFVGGGNIGTWPDLIRAFAPRDPDAEAQLERAFYLRQ
jgi:hypothetical protein